jgi:hypothetical protein
MEQLTIKDRTKLWVGTASPTRGIDHRARARAHCVVRSIPSTPKSAPGIYLHRGDAQTRSAPALTTRNPITPVNEMVQEVGLVHAPTPGQETKEQASQNPAAAIEKT